MKNIEQGLAELDRGEGRPADEVFRELKLKYIRIMEISDRNRERIRTRLESGQFATTDELLDVALNLLDELESADNVDLARIDLARAQLARGEGIPAEEVFAAIRARKPKSN